MFFVKVTVGSKDGSRDNPVIYDFIVGFPAIDEGRDGGSHSCGESGSSGKSGGRE